jgi:hypothetical protein
MSRPVLSSATRHLSRQHVSSPAVPSRRFSTTRPILTISATFDRNSPSAQPVVNILSTSRKTQLSPSRFPRSSASPFAVPRQRCAFSSSAQASAKAIQNSRTGDDGNALMVGISSRAAEVGRFRLFPLFVKNAYDVAVVRGSGFRADGRSCASIHSTVAMWMDRKGIWNCPP